MSWRRGFIRIWLVLTVIWIGAMGYLAYDAYQTPARRAEIMAQIPVICADARGQQGVDYDLDQNRGLHRSDRSYGPEWYDACWYSVDAYKRLYQPDPSLSIAEIRRAGYASAISVDAVVPEIQDEWWMIRRFALAAILPPLGLLVVGSIFGWMFAGFKRPTET